MHWRYGVMSDDKQQPRNGVEIPTSKELDEVASDGQSQQGGSREQKGIRSWVRRFWVWLRRGVWRNRKALKTPRPDIEPVIREVPPDIKPVPDEDTKRPVSREEQSRVLARCNAQENGHVIGDFVEQVRQDRDKESTATCKKCGLDILAMVTFGLYDVKGTPQVGGKAKGVRCKG